MPDSIKTDALRLLGNYDVVFPGEARRTRLVRRFVEQSAAPEDRDWAPEHLTASGVVLSQDRKCVLQIWNKKLGLWLQPGGHFDPEDRSALACAQREVFEETGIDSKSKDKRGPDLLTLKFAGSTGGGSELFDVDSHAIAIIHGAKRRCTRHHDLRFVFLLRGEPDVMLAKSEVLAWRWVPVGRLKLRKSSVLGRKLVKLADKLVECD